jgi:hypothetical protein
MELVPLPCAVDHHNWMEADILEVLQTQSTCHLGVEAAAAKLPVALLDRAVVHDIVGRDGRATRFAADCAAALLTFVSHVSRKVKHLPPAIGIKRIEVSDEREDDEDEDRAPTTRLWLIQCKREKTITPKKLGEYLEGLPQSRDEPIYGLIFAAACDLSKTSRDLFRTKAREMGFSEAYLWGKGEVEDQLFQPKNDHLLFAYCGFSLQVRKRGLKTEVRSYLSTKRKATKLLQDSTGNWRTMIQWKLRSAPASCMRVSKPGLALQMSQQHKYQNDDQDETKPSA